MARPPQKYQEGERVRVQGWAKSDIGTVASTDWIYHDRMSGWCWGYAVRDWDGDGPGLTFTYIPEGYLRSL